MEYHSTTCHRHSSCACDCVHRLGHRVRFPARLFAGTGISVLGAKLVRKSGTNHSARSIRWPMADGAPTAFTLSISISTSGIVWSHNQLFCQSPPLADEMLFSCACDLCAVLFSSCSCSCWLLVVSTWNQVHTQRSSGIALMGGNHQHSSKSGQHSGCIALLSLEHDCSTPKQATMRPQRVTCDIDGINMGGDRAKCKPSQAAQWDARLPLNCATQN